MLAGFHSMRAAHLKAAAYDLSQKEFRKIPAAYRADCLPVHILYLPDAFAAYPLKALKARQIFS